jgi:hypothetical protein
VKRLLLIILLLTMVACKKEPVAWDADTKVAPKDGNYGIFPLPWTVISVAGQGDGWIEYNLNDSSIPKRKLTSYHDDLKKVYK